VAPLAYLSKELTIMATTKKPIPYEKSKKDKEAKGMKEMSKGEKAMDKRGMAGMKGKKKC
jgi:hypothetical protein